MLGDNGLSYDPEEGKWNLVRRGMVGFYQHFESAIEDVLYCYDEGEVRWYDTNVKLWKRVKGLEVLPKIPRYSPVSFADYGGKMAVLWDKFVPSSGYKNKMIWCAVIALERRENHKIYGNVEWCDAVLTVPKSYVLEFALAATL